MTRGWPAHDPPPPLDTTRLVDALIDALRSHRGTPAAQHVRAVFIGHSLGTALLASVIKARPSLAGAAMFVTLLSEQPRAVLAVDVETHGWLEPLPDTYKRHRGAVWQVALCIIEGGNAPRELLAFATRPATEVGAAGPLPGAAGGVQ